MLRWHLTPCAFTLAFLATGTAAAVTREAGPGKTYATPCAAIAAAQPGDEIQVSPATYTDSCQINVANLTVRGVGGRPKIDLSGTNHPADYKGAFVVQADGVTIENIEITGVHIDPANGENGAAIRSFNNDLTVRGCYLHDNQNGILSADGDITVEYTELARNGRGDACSQGGCTHNIYVNHANTCTFRYNWTHDIANDTQDKGHLLKSRAQKTYVLYNRISGESSINSYEIDFPNGGLAIVVGNMIQKSAQSAQPIMVRWGEEGVTNTDLRLFFVNNTFVSDRASTQFIVVAATGVLAAKNNLFVGSGTTPAGLSADNLSGIDPLFVDRAGFDYHLQATSPARNVGVAAGSADSFALTPDSEYLHPTNGVARASDGMLDVGAFELGTDLDAGTFDGGGKSDGSTSSDGGGVGPEGSTGGGPDSGGVTSPSGGTDGGNAAAGGGDGGESGGSDGCSCATLGRSHGAVGSAVLAGIGLVALARWRRRSRMRA